MVKKYVKPAATVEKFSTENYVANLCQDLEEIISHPAPELMRENAQIYVDGSNDSYIDNQLNWPTNTAKDLSNHWNERDIKYDASGNTTIRWAWWKEEVDANKPGNGSNVSVTDPRYTAFKVIQLKEGGGRHWGAYTSETVITHTQS